MVFNRHQLSSLSLAAALTSSLLLVACGGSSSSTSSTVAKGEASEYTGKTSAAELPSTEEGKQALAETIVKAFKVKNIPLIRAEEFGEEIIDSRGYCKSGTATYKEKVVEEYDEDEDETFKDIVKADAVFNNCDDGWLGVLNGEFHYNSNETKTFATDTYSFKNLSVEETEEDHFEYRQHQFNGEYLNIYKLRSDGDIDITQNWNFGITFTDANETIKFKSLGKQTHVADFYEDEAKSLPQFEASFTFSDKTYLLTYKDLVPNTYYLELDNVKFYDPELGYYNLGVDRLNNTGCSKNGASYTGLDGEILIRDDSGAQLLAITASCDGVTFQ